MGFCSNCGAELAEGAAFCTKCGAKTGDQSGQGNGNNPVTPVQMPGQGAGNNSGRKLSNKSIGIIAVAVVGVLVLFLLVKFVSLIATPGYERPLKNYFNSIEKYDVGKAMDSLPDYITDQVNDMIDDGYDGDIEGYSDDFQEMLENQFGKKIRISYEIKDKDRMDKDDIEELEGQVEYSYDEKVNIKDAYTLEIEGEIKGSEEEESFDEELIVIKIGSKWYLYDDSSFGL